MTPAEWEAIGNEVMALWGRSPKWLKADQLWRYAQTIPEAAATEAVQSVFLEGRSTAPPPAEILGRAKGMTTEVMTPQEIERYCDSHGHLWSIVGEENKMRELLCCRCHATDTRPAHRAPTEGEIEMGIFTGQPERAGYEAITDQIAP